VCEWELEEGGYYDGLTEEDLDWLQHCTVHNGSYQGDGEPCSEATNEKEDE
jgi:hypothetical protein